MGTLSQLNHHQAPLLNWIKAKCASSVIQHVSWLPGGAGNYNCSQFCHCNMLLIDKDQAQFLKNPSSLFLYTQVLPQISHYFWYHPSETGLDPGTLIPRCLCGTSVPHWKKDNLHNHFFSTAGPQIMSFHSFVIILMGCCRKVTLYQLSYGRIDFVIYHFP